MGHERQGGRVAPAENAAAVLEEGVQVAAQSSDAEHSANGALEALCVLARYHQVAADPATLAHQLGLSPHEAVDVPYVLRGARQLGLKAKRSVTRADRLALASLPALAVLCDAQGRERIVILARCDGQRVLLQDPSNVQNGTRTVIESFDEFTRHWTGELILITSRASLAGELAKFDFSWFIPSLVKHRKLLGEVLLISFILQLFALISPLFFQVVMDKVLVHHGVTTLDVLVIGLVVWWCSKACLTACAATSSATPPTASMWNWARGCFAIWFSCRWRTFRHAGWAIRWPGCASWRTFAAFSPATR